ncbi:unnamed protein product [Symbiodinium sp. CCMP2456]|nr:unnamed protein product [Symbiodinium sp. CCMP2456]
MRKALRAEPLEIQSVGSHAFEVWTPGWSSMESEIQEAANLRSAVRIRLQTAAERATTLEDEQFPKATCRMRGPAVKITRVVTSGSEVEAVPKDPLLETSTREGALAFLELLALLAAAPDDGQEGGGQAAATSPFFIQEASDNQGGERDGGMDEHTGACISGYADRQTKLGPGGDGFLADVSGHPKKLLQVMVLGSVADPGAALALAGVDDDVDKFMLEQIRELLDEAEWEDAYEKCSTGLLFFGELQPGLLGAPVPATASRNGKALRLLRARAMVGAGFAGAAAEEVAALQDQPGAAEILGRAAQTQRRYPEAELQLRRAASEASDVAAEELAAASAYCSTGARQQHGEVDVLQLLKMHEALECRPLSDSCGPLHFVSPLVARRWLGAARGRGVVAQEAMEEGRAESFHIRQVLARLCMDECYMRRLVPGGFEG